MLNKYVFKRYKSLYPLQALAKSCIDRAHSYRLKIQEALLSFQHVHTEETKLRFTGSVVKNTNNQMKKITTNKKNILTSRKINECR